MTDLEMMQHVGEWPHLIGLPLKRRSNFDIHNPESFGVLVCSGMTKWPPNEKPSVVVGANVWDATSFEGRPRKEYETLEDVVREWLVD
jgi:hypothetical protein